MACLTSSHCHAGQTLSQVSPSAANTSNNRTPYSKCAKTCLLVFKMNTGKTNFSKSVSPDVLPTRNTYFCVVLSDPQTRGNIFVCQITVVISAVNGFYAFWAKQNLYLLKENTRKARLTFLVWGDSRNDLATTPITLRPATLNQGLSWHFVFISLCHSC